MKRRQFISGIPAIASLPILEPTGIWRQDDGFSAQLKSLASIDQTALDYWKEVRALYDQSDDMIDLNSAGLSSITNQVHAAFNSNNDKLYKLPSKYISRYYRQEKQLRTEFAKASNCKSEEIVLQRNATEALSAAIFGIPLNRGDEVIVGKYDYPHVFYSWRQRADREGIILKYVDLGKSNLSPKKITKKYLEQVTEKTKAIQITDLINYSGCQVPSADIIKRLPENVRYRIVDMAQSFANNSMDLSAIGATHIGLSLHKWLGAPIGTGLLFVGEDYISETWPLFSSFSGDEKTISKFSHLGTRNASIYPAISFALQFHLTIGTERKRKRLRYLANYLSDGLLKINGIQLISPQHTDLKSNIVVASHRKISSVDIYKSLWQDYKIHTTPLAYETIHGVRFSPNVFTREEDLDRTLKAIESIVAHKS